MATKTSTTATRVHNEYKILVRGRIAVQWLPG